MTSERTPLIPKPSGVVEMSNRDFWLLLTGIWTTTFIGSVDGTIVATLLGPMASSFESMQLAQWIGSAYLLSVCCFTPLYGRLCNIIGRRTSSILASSIFAIGTTLCGVAQTMNQLIFFRALAGVGGGGMTVVGSVIMSDIVPLKSRGLYQGFANLLFGLGGAIGAPLGGWLGDTIGWRAAFFLQGPVLACGLVLMYLEIREPEFIISAPKDGLWAKVKRVDFAGPFALAVSLGCFLVSLSYKTSAHLPWSNPQVYGYLAASVSCMILFIAVEAYAVPEPVMPLSMLKMRTPGWVALNNFLVAVLSFSTIYTVPLYFTAFLLRSSSNAGAHLIPNSVAVAVGSLLAGWYMRKTGKYWWYQFFASSGLVIANVGLVSWNHNTPEWIYYITLIPSGFAFASVLTTTLLALFASVSRDNIPIATGVSYLFRTAGQVLGVALSSTLLQGLLASNLRARITGENADETIEKILDSVSVIRYLPPDIRAKATESWGIALRGVFYAQLAVAVILFLSVIPIGEHPLPDRAEKSPVDEEATPVGVATNNNTQAANA
ncbi:MFS general substrate transporter [Cylindrobasidium torrendii FP15055 ss-10]|uniref:MFS general substrate transporter n=1 Tax=Cylindrobasidium torrendii FP15055 ss-10 TaxID=1314674 RepID=A0A0D7BN12_9AGAR|nr:MFS general substrate transporter [Cylindrobasidium torrendii FP15055 ss-10]